MIAGSQSRWIKQQEYYLNVDGLMNSTTNKYGGVDANGKVVSLYNQTHRRGNGNFTAATSSAFVLNVDGFGSGKNSLSYLQDNLMTSASVPALDYDTPFYFATTFKNAKPQTWRAFYSIGNVSLGAQIMFGISGGALVLQHEYSRLGVAGIPAVSRRVSSSSSQYNDNQIYRVVYFSAGTNDSADDKIYVEGVEIATFEDSPGDLSGLSLSPSDSRLTMEIFGTQGTEGEIGNVILGKGQPDIDKIMKYL